MFLMFPHHALPRPHEMIKIDLPAPTKSMSACYKEMIPVWMRQFRDEDIYLAREMSPAAKPYRPELHGQAVPVAAE